MNENTLTKSLIHIGVQVVVWYVVARIFYEGLTAIFFEGDRDGFNALIVLISVYGPLFIIGSLSQTYEFDKYLKKTSDDKLLLNASLMIAISLICYAIYYSGK